MGLVEYWTPTAKNLEDGTAGQIPYQATASTTAFVGGTANQILVSNGAAPPAFVNAGSLITAQTDITGGTAGSVLYQAAPSDTQFLSGTQNQILQSNGSSAPTFTEQPVLKKLRLDNTVAPLSIAEVIDHAGTDEAVQINCSGVGTGLRINGSTSTPFHAIYNQPSAAQDNKAYYWQNNGATISSVGQKATTGNLELISDSGVDIAAATDTTIASTNGNVTVTAIAGNVGLVGQDVYMLSNITLPSKFIGLDGLGKVVPAVVEDIDGGLANQIVYQTAPGATSFTGPGTTGQVLTGVTGGAPVFAASSGIAAGSATNIAGGIANQLPYQTAPDATSFVAPGLTDQLLRGTTGAAPSWTASSNVTAGKATNIVGGSSGVVPYQTAVDATSFTNLGTAGQFLVGGAAPSFSSTLTNATNAASLTINQNGLGEGILINCSTTSVGFRINIPATQIYNSLYHQSNAATGNYTLFTQVGPPTKISYLGQDATTGDFRINTDKKIILQSATGSEIVQASTLINPLTWKQNNAAKVSSIAQEVTTGNFTVTTDSAFKVTGTSVTLNAPAILNAPYLGTDATGLVVPRATPGSPAVPVLYIYKNYTGVNQTFTIPVGVRLLEIWVTGGGGGGGGANITGAAGGGGGETAYYYVAAPYAFADFDVFVGDQGSGGAGGPFPANGTNGGNSYIQNGGAGLSVIAYGGDGGRSDGVGAFGGYYFRAGQPFGSATDRYRGGDSQGTNAVRTMGGASMFASPAYDYGEYGGGGVGGNAGGASGANGGYGYVKIKAYY